MPANRNALIRYKTIDSCLCNRQKRWTLEMLIEKVSDVLYDYEGMDKGISRRTIQADIQMMRSDKLGYYAPIVIVDKKYYTYEDPEYSITNIPLSGEDLARMNEAVEMLKQFKGFSHFNNLNDVVQKLESHVHAASSNQRPAIHFEKNDNLKGLVHLDTIYQAIVQEKALDISYQSFKARDGQRFFFHVWWLKEFKNRWFAVGMQGNKQDIYTLALDRMSEVSISEEMPYRSNKTYTPDDYYKDVIGVTVSPTMRPVEVQLWVSAQHAPYVLTKPLHHSQELVEEREDKSVVIQLHVQQNYEMEREILGFGAGMIVLSPERLRKAIKYHVMGAARQYEVEL
jgi:predicted DNA-binding transcriptional regulator YafY